MNDTILYVRYYERIDELHDLITKKYYDLCEEHDVQNYEKIGEVYPMYVFLDDIESAADKR